MPLNIQPREFTVGIFDSVVTMDLSGQLEGEAIVAIDASCIATLNVSLSDMQSVFRYQTDASDVINAAAEDLKYKVDVTDWPELNPVNATVDPTNAIATGYGESKMFVAHDFIRHLAKELFNTHHGVDLFSNEKEMLQSLRRICGSDEGSTWANITAILEAAAAAPLTNAEDGSNNVTRVLMRQMIQVDPDRFQTISISDDFQALPFTAGDSINFKLTINPADNQQLIVERDENVKSRSYQIKLLIVDGEATNVLVDEAETA